MGPESSSITPGNCLARSLMRAGNPVGGGGDFLFAAAAPAPDNTEISTSSGML
jgi:hypothetical protein